MDADSRQRFDNFLDEFQRIIDGETFPFHIEIRDPLGNSFVSARVGSTTPPDNDSLIVMEDYERSEYENEIFGIADMTTDNYDEHGQQVGGSQMITDQILADRLTQAYRKAPDHPIAFAKGAEDSTVPLGTEAPLRPGQRSEQPNEDDNHPVMEAYYALADDESSFEASVTFQGCKEGKVFRSGSLGIGYYKDKYPGNK